VEDVEQKSRREDVLNQILLLLNTAIGRIKLTVMQKHQSYRALKG
jgi:nitrate reductase gamma subunit